MHEPPRRLVLPIGSSPRFGRSKTGRDGTASEVQTGTDEQGGIKIQLRIHGAPDIISVAEPVLFALKEKVADRNIPALKPVHHQLRLVRRNDLVLGALEKYHRN